MELPEKAPFNKKITNGGIAGISASVGSAVSIGVYTGDWKAAVIALVTMLFPVCVQLFFAWLKADPERAEFVKRLNEALEKPV